jgi:hypothetical protein
MLQLSPDVVIALANFGLAIVFWPLLIRNQRRRYCHIPLTTSVPKTALLALLCIGELMAQLPIAAAVCLLDVACWCLFVAQRQVLGDHPRWDGGWFCPWCDVAVAPEEVTNDERHDPRAGGCGRYVEAD